MKNGFYLGYTVFILHAFYILTLWQISPTPPEGKMHDETGQWTFEWGLSVVGNGES